MQRNLKKVAARKAERAKRLSLTKEVMERTLSAMESEYDEIAALLDLAARSLAVAYDGYVEFCPGLSEVPRTLSGWKALQQRIETELSTAGFQDGRDSAGAKTRIRIPKARQARS